MRWTLPDVRVPSPRDRLDRQATGACCHICVLGPPDDKLSQSLWRVEAVEDGEWMVFNASTGPKAPTPCPKNMTASEDDGALHCVPLRGQNPPTGDPESWAMPTAAIRLQARLPGPRVVPTRWPRPLHRGGQEGPLAIREATLTWKCLVELF